jgi:hypothetical protein
LASALIGKTAFAQTNAVLVKLDDETKNIFRDATTDTWFKKDSFTRGLVGGLAAVVAVFVADSLQRKKERQADDEFDQRVPNAI